MAESTAFLGQREAALAAIERLAEKYRIDVEEMRDEEKRTRVVATPAGWRRHVAIHLAFYLGLNPSRPRGIRRGSFLLDATDAEFELFTETLEFHLKNITGYEWKAGAEVRMLQIAVKDEKRRLREAVRLAKKAVTGAKREKAAKMKWYWQGYVMAVMPMPSKGRKCRITAAEAEAHDAGTKDGRAVQIEKGRPALERSRG